MLLRIRFNLSEDVLIGAGTAFLLLTREEGCISFGQSAVTNVMVLIVGNLVAWAPNICSLSTSLLGSTRHG